MAINLNDPANLFFGWMKGECSEALLREKIEKLSQQAAPPSSSLKTAKGCLNLVNRLKKIKDVVYPSYEELKKDDDSAFHFMNKVHSFFLDFLKKQMGLQKLSLAEAEKLLSGLPPSYDHLYASLANYIYTNYQDDESFILRGLAAWLNKWKKVDLEYIDVFVCPIEKVASRLEMLDFSQNKG